MRRWTSGSQRRSTKMISGEPFAAICETFADLPEAGAAQESAALLVRWIEDGIIHRIDQAA